MHIALVKNNLEEAQKILSTFLSDEENLQKVAAAAEIMLDSIQHSGKIISCGNGGSMCDAMHFAEELTGRFRENRKAIAAISISDPSHLTCVGNDYGFDQVFSRYIEAVGRKGDVLLAISTSGNSENVLNAILVAQKLGMKIIGLTGKTGGKIAEYCDIEIRAPHSAYADRAQEIHIKVIHSLIHCMEKSLQA